ncbi:MAG: C40 family peptidase [Paludibacteraceae bacterium]|nr:C40 family peptidase [Paludibacteraceae bacterium]
MKVIALHSVIPLRAEAREQAEQVTQMLFGQTAAVLEQLPSWTRIRLDDDGQVGWADAKMLTPLSDAEQAQVEDALSRATARVMMPMAYAVSANNRQTLPLTAGTLLPDYHDGRFALLGVPFLIDPAMVAAQPIPLNEDTLMRVTRFFLNIPYLWGGKNAMGMDCSGFTQVVLSLFGHRLPRNASEQAACGQPVSDLREAQAGDIALFDHAPDSTRISHVGILLDNTRIIHCSGRVKVETIDPQGILSVERNNTYTHHLAAIRRLLH